MIDIVAAIQVAEAAFELGITWSDAQTLYALYTTTKSSGKIDFNTLSKSGALQADVDAIARVSNVLSTLLKDKTQGPRIVGILGSLSA